MLFQKKRKYATIPSETTKRDIPEGLMNKCTKCGAILYSKDLEKNLKVCASCGYHFIIGPDERIAYTLDEGRLFEYDEDMVTDNPLQFPEYEQAIAKEIAKTNHREAIVTGEGTIGGFPVVVGIMNFKFYGGSMGSVVGEKIARAIEAAIQKQYPFILFSTSGGARMQEGILSLMQMAKTSAMLNKLHEQGGLYISVLTDPTYGGVSASFSMLGDLILAEPGARFGFAGPRVVEQTIRQKVDAVQTAEHKLKNGQVDKVVHRKELRPLLTKLLEMHTGGGSGTWRAN
ncbi:acetyl-CoA carboxylase, carboxyltransferase subunit beta [Paenibacillus cymbidii]|uniref:acetyl-CoA carboxylase, carboxyltransferase subunit beta n=1 Tax=Paenibacillus cymbidii TaxID=1639034 RepID=UPI0022A8C311|nr:acetyl-CoA carboxylase, carboxyltransferase subunit beta [Paenibacillus cymbidii]